MENLINFVNEDYVYRVNLEFPRGIDMKVVKAISKVSDKVYVRIINGADFEFIPEMQEEGIKFFFDNNMPANNWIHLRELVENFGVTDVYLYDDLLYDLQAVRTYCDDYDVQIRAILNRIPITPSFGDNQYKTDFIFRPQDLSILEKYFDIFEFDCGETTKWNEFNVLFDTWFIDGTWTGDLREINKDLKEPFMNPSVHPAYTLFKMNCGLRCTKRKNNQCHKCAQLWDLGDTFYKEGIGLKAIDAG